MPWTPRMKSLGSPAMNTTELIAKIAEAHGVSKAQAKSIVEDIFKDIVDSAASGAEVSLSGFGKFKVKVTPEREGRNPASGGAPGDRRGV
jgi:DNA-binding protein HU-beta